MAAYARMHRSPSRTVNKAVAQRGASLFYFGEQSSE